MRMTSLESVRQSAAAAFRRFPAPLVCAWAACACFDIAIFSSKQRFFTAGLLLALGIPLTFAATLRRERSPRASFGLRWLPHLVILAVLAVLIAVWPRWTDAIQARRYAQLSLFAHALVAFFPYLGVREPNGFWQYNRALLERFILTSIFGGV